MHDFDSDRKASMELSMIKVLDDIDRGADMRFVMDETERSRVLRSPDVTLDVRGRVELAVAHYSGYPPYGPLWTIPCTCAEALMMVAAMKDA